MARWQVTVVSEPDEAHPVEAAARRLAAMVEEADLDVVVEDGCPGIRMRLLAIDDGAAADIARRRWEQLVLQAGVKVGPVRRLEVVEQLRTS